MSNEAEEIEALLAEIAQEASKGPFVTGWPGPWAIDELYVAARLVLAARQERDALQAKLDRIESTQRTYYDVEARAAQAEKELDEARTRGARLEAEGAENVRLRQTVEMYDEPGPEPKEDYGFYSSGWIDGQNDVIRALLQALRRDK